MPSERKCVRALRILRWGKHVRCAYCDSPNIIHNGTRNYIHNHICKDCGKCFNEKTGTIFENSKMQLREWFYIARELHRGISINQISRDLGREYDNVHRIAKKIMENVFMQRFIKALKGDIEIDEMYHSVGQKGAKCTDRKPRKRGLKLRGRGTWDKDKPPIVGIFQRGGNIILEVFRNVTKDAVSKLATWFIDGNAIKYTDDFRSYEQFGHVYDHQTVNHSKKQYAIGDIHTNGIEGIFQGLRHWLNGSKGVCKKNLKYFVAMFEFNFNNRFLKPMDKFMLLMKEISII